jgi:hypothetical protein
MRRVGTPRWRRACCLAAGWTSSGMGGKGEEWEAPEPVKLEFLSSGEEKEKDKGIFLSHTPHTLRQGFELSLHLLFNEKEKMRRWKSRTEEKGRGRGEKSLSFQARYQRSVKLRTVKRSLDHFDDEGDIGEGQVL